MLLQISQNATDLNLQRTEVSILLLQHADVFAVDDNDLGHTNVIRHTIQHQYDKQQGAPPVHNQQEVTRLVDDMLNIGISLRAPGLHQLF